MCILKNVFHVIFGKSSEKQGNSASVGLIGGGSTEQDSNSCYDGWSRTAHGICCPLCLQGTAPVVPASIQMPCVCDVFMVIASSAC